MTAPDTRRYQMSAISSITKKLLDCASALDAAGYIAESNEVILIYSAMWDHHRSISKELWAEQMERYRREDEE